jgi:hypothetical protein
MSTAAIAVIVTGPRRVGDPRLRASAASGPVSPAHHPAEPFSRSSDGDHEAQSLLDQPADNCGVDRRRRSPSTASPGSLKSEAWDFLLGRTTRGSRILLLGNPATALAGSGCSISPGGVAVVTVAPQCGHRATAGRSCTPAVVGSKEIRRIVEPCPLLVMLASRGALWACRPDPLGWRALSPTAARRPSTVGEARGQGRPAGPSAPADRAATLDRETGRANQGRQDLAAGGPSASARPARP